MEMGFNLYSLPQYRQAIDTTIETGKPVSITSVTLQNGADGYIVLKPIYAGRVLPADQAERRSQVLYVVVVVMQSKDLLVQNKISEHWDVRILKNGKNLSRDDRTLYQFNNYMKKNQGISFSDMSFEKPVHSEAQPLMLSTSLTVGPEVIRQNVILFAFIVWASFLALILYIINTHYSRLREREQSLQAWQWEKERADVTLHSLADAVITTNLKGVIEYLNPVAEKLTGWSINQARGLGVEDVFKLVSEADDKAITCPVMECIQRGVMKKSSGDLSLMNRNGELNAVDYSIAPMFGSESLVLGAALVFQDVGSSRMMSKLLSYQATHDDLSGLYNRREFEQRLSRAIERVFNHDEHHVLLYMDLDQFKVVNDTCGHVAGDLVLRQVAEVIVPLLQDRETLARLGGDEFGILLENYSLDDAKALSKRILNAIRKYRFNWSGMVFEIGISIGIVDIDSGMQSISNIMSYADAACYMAKDMGGNNMQLYQMDDDDYKQRKDQMKWVQRITQAFADSRFMLYAQRISPLQSEETDEHYEILMRMLDDNGDVIEPQDYIIAAERYRTMVDIDRWVVRNAFISISQYVLKQKADESLPERIFSVNLSGQSLGNATALDYIKEQLNEFPEVISYVVFEITETVAISNLVSAQNFITEFRAMGVQFSLDDFGTGVSSFSYLKNLQVDYLKIDGGFVREMVIDPVDYAMVKSIAHIGHVMGIKTIAEHTETEEVCDKLRDIGVDYAQGYWLHSPEPLENLI